MCYYQQEDYAKAIKYLEDYLQNHLQDAEVLYSIGRSYIDMEQYKRLFHITKKRYRRILPKQAGLMNLVYCIIIPIIIKMQPLLLIKH